MFKILFKVQLIMRMKKCYNVLILDTAGRLQIDVDMMAELLFDRQNIQPAGKTSCNRCHDRAGSR